MSVERWTGSVPVEDVGGFDAELGFTVYADPAGTGPRTVAVSLPGGGYARDYFDLRHPLLAGSGQALHHASRGWVFLSFDSLGSGDSQAGGEDVPDFHQSVAIHHAGMTAALARLVAGDLVDGLGPVTPRQVVGVGHSLGGMQLIAQQGLHATFDALAVLGFSAIHTVVPSEDGLVETRHDTEEQLGQAPEDAWAGPLVDDPSHFAYAFFWDDIPSELAAADLGVGFPKRTAEVLPPWVSRTFPSCAAVGMEPGVVAAEAARIQTPVLVVGAERDVIPDLHAEAAAYPASGDITLVALPRCAHLHNFSPQRFVLWDRLHAWADSLDPSSTSNV